MATAGDGSEPLRDVVVRLVPPELLLELPDRGPLVDEDELDAGDPA
jgi:hypothetical protein